MSFIGEDALTNMTLGEGNFDDGNKASGTATPAEPAADAPPAKKKRVAGGKKAKTTKQRLAIADGHMDG